MAQTLLDTCRTASRLQALCGLSPKALATLIESAVPALVEARRQRQQARPRQRALGGGRKRTLAPEREILLTLIYLRHNVAHEVVGALFGVSADTSEDTFHEVVAVLREVCPAHRWDAEKQWKKSEPSWQPDEPTRLLVDTFETPVCRPSTEAAQRRVYSGKKKSHTLKTQVVTDAAGEILEIDAGHRGPTADKTLYEQSEAAGRYPNAERFGDKAYQGTPGMRLPHKKPRGGELSEAQRAENREHAAVRVYVEHANRRLKAFGILRGKYRLALGLFPRIAMVVVGLVHLTRLVG
jgi:hypothetical protein